MFDIKCSATIIQSYRLKGKTGALSLSLIFSEMAEI